MAPIDRDKTVYLVDGTAQLFRAYFALPGLTSPDGLPTNAVFGFTTMLRKLIREEGPSHMAIAFDLPGKTFRNERYPKYKANRPPTPEDLNRQLPYARRVCEVLGVPVVEQPGFEADDLIATYTRNAREAGFPVVVVASDKDLFQLVGDGVTLLHSTKNIRLDVAGIRSEFGVGPDRVLDAQGLMGDSVDNIPGVPGIGEKTAISILSTYGDLDSAIARAGRFVRVFDCRDLLLDAIVAIESAEVLEERQAEAARVAAVALAERLRQFADAEADPEMRRRAEELGEQLGRTDFDSLSVGLGGPGKNAARAIRPLKKELKGLDRGSSRKVWSSIHENADQARLSRELATLDSAMTVPLGLEDLKLAGPDREQARALFEELGFQALVTEFARSDDDLAVAAGPAAGSAYQTVLTAARLAEIVGVCRAAGRLAVAVATDGPDPLRSRLIGIGLSVAADAGWYVPLGHSYLGVPDQLAGDLVAEKLGPLLADEDLSKVSHDSKAVAHVLRRHGMPLRGLGLDTSVAAFLLDAGRTGYGLSAVVRQHLRREAADLAEITGSGAGRTPLEHAEIEPVASRMAQQADLILQLAGRLEERLETAELDRLYRTIDGPLLPLLARMEQRGIRIDVPLLETMSGEMETTLDRTRSEIHGLAGREFNIDSPKQLREVLFDELGLRPRRKTAKSKVSSTDAETLEELAALHPIAGKLLEYRETSKLKSTYVDSLPRLVHPETGRVHTCFHPTGAATGRLSSSDPNLQNIPVRTEAGRRIRSAFIPADGCLFLASDYSQIELRVLAHMTDDESLVRAFAAGEDIHRFTASRVFGTSPDLVTDEMRRRAKAVNFGILYGMSETRLAREQGMKRAEARQFIENYFDRFASVRGYIEAVREQALRDGSVRTLFGRLRPFPQLHGRVHRGIQEQALRAAVNTTLQGTAADLMKLAMLAVERELERAGLGARVLLQVHDELLLELPEAELDRTRAVVRQAMENVHPLRVPLVVDQKSGRSWLEA